LGAGGGGADDCAQADWTHADGATPHAIKAAINAARPAAARHGKFIEVSKIRKIPPRFRLRGESPEPTMPARTQA
jgi:hypothetical protein